VEEFSRLFVEQPSRIDVRDSKGRSATHQAAARNKVGILQFIHNHNQGNSSNLGAFISLLKPNYF